VRDSAVTALTGLATTGSNVFASSVYPLSDGSLPCLKVYTRSDSFGAMEREYVSVTGTWGGYAREIELVVEAHVKVVTDFDDTLDTICEEVEAALEAKSAWTANVGQVTYGGTTIEYLDEAELRQGVATIVYQIGWFPSLT